MAGKGQRKILVIGKSRAITLPQEWADYNELTADDHVIVIYDSLLIVIPEKHYDKVIERSGDMIKNLVESTPNIFIMKPSIDLRAFLEEEARKRDMSVEDTSIQILRERLNQSKE